MPGISDHVLFLWYSIQPFLVYWTSCNFHVPKHATFLPNNEVKLEKIDIFSWQTYWLLLATCGGITLYTIMIEDLKEKFVKFCKKNLCLVFEACHCCFPTQSRHRVVLLFLSLPYITLLPPPSLPPPSLLPYFPPSTCYPPYGVQISLQLSHSQVNWLMDLNGCRHRAWNGSE